MDESIHDLTYLQGLKNAIVHHWIKRKILSKICHPSKKGKQLKTYIPCSVLITL